MTSAFADPVTRGIVAAAAAVLLLAALVITGLAATRRASPALVRELWLRSGSWAVLLPLMLGPVLLGRVWTIGVVTLLGLVCLREYDRATGLFREYVITATLTAGVLAMNAAALDAWYGLFMALIPLIVGLVAIVSIPLDRPAGYVQRTGLAIFAFMLFGTGLAHLGYMANDGAYRPLVLMLLTTVALNDVFAFARLLEDGAVLILFPEGTRSRTGTMSRFRPGIGTLVAGHPIPVVPCFLAGAHAAWPPTQRLPRPGRLHLVISPALTFEATSADRAGTVAVAAVCEAAVRALIPAGRAGVVVSGAGQYGPPQTSPKPEV